MTIPLYLPAPQWVAPRCEFIEVFHGCTSTDKANMDANGIDIGMCRVDTDFGRGFYTTTVKYQANQWAWNRFYDPAVRHVPMNQPVVLTFRVKRHELAQMSFISFVLADPGKDDFWSLVQHCRQSTPQAINDHRGPEIQMDGTSWYDVAWGPVSAFWRQKFAMQDADQISFHTPKSVALLNRLIRSGNDIDYRHESLQ